MTKFYRSKEVYDGRVAYLDKKLDMAQTNYDEILSYRNMLRNPKNLWEWFWNHTTKANLEHWDRRVESAKNGLDNVIKEYLKFLDDFAIKE